MLGGLGEKSRQIESDVERFVVTSIVKYFAKFNTFNNSTETEFILNGQLYHIRHGPRINKPTLEIFILNSSVPQKQAIYRII